MKNLVKNFSEFNRHSKMNENYNTLNEGVLTEFSKEKFDKLSNGTKGTFEIRKGDMENPDILLSYGGSGTSGTISREQLSDN
jgi:hypothetical protein